MSGPIVISDRVYIPEGYLDLRYVRSKYQTKFYNESGCSRCDYKPDRHCDTCETCSNYMGEYKFWDKSKGRISLPLGDKAKLLDVCPEFKDYKLIDKRVAPPMRNKNRIKLVRKLYPDQILSIKEVSRHTSGIIKAPPRSGKTVIATGLAVKLGTRTLILASQYDWLEQFYEVIYGSKREKPFTNARDLKNFAGIAKTMDDYFKYDIVLSTYQKFISKNGADRLAKVKDAFGMIIIDEVHQTGAPLFGKVVNKFKSKYRFGMTATVERKDGKDLVPLTVIGKVISEVKTKTLTPKVQVHCTNRIPKLGNVWTRAMRAIERDKERNKIIVRQVISDLEDDRNILIPCIFTSQIKNLSKSINKAIRVAQKRGKLLDLPRGNIVAEFYGGRTKEMRRKIILGARSGQIRVTLGMRKLIQLGLNVPSWDTIYTIMPIANPPNYHQETSRIRTVSKNKKQPLVRFFVDANKLSTSCFRICYFQTFVKEGFEIDQNTRDICRTLFNGWGR